MSIENVLAEAFIVVQKQDKEELRKETELLSPVHNDLAERFLNGIKGASVKFHSIHNDLAEAEIEAGESGLESWQTTTRLGLVLLWEVLQLSMQFGYGEGVGEETNVFEYNPKGWGGNHTNDGTYICGESPDHFYNDLRITNYSDDFRRQKMVEDALRSLLLKPSEPKSAMWHPWGKGISSETGPKAWEEKIPVEVRAKFDDRSDPYWLGAWIALCEKRGKGKEAVDLVKTIKGYPVEFEILVEDRIAARRTIPEKYRPKDKHNHDHEHITNFPTLERALRYADRQTQRVEIRLEGPYHDWNVIPILPLTEEQLKEERKEKEMANALLG